MNIGLSEQYALTKRVTRLTENGFQAKVKGEIRRKGVPMDYADIDLSLIVAMTPERIIGKDGRLPWRMPSDLARFRRITTDIGVVVMGRKTFRSITDAIGGPLPGRQHVVLTRSGHLENNHVWQADGVSTVREMVGSLGGRACITGGAEIYELFIAANLVRRVHLTIVHAAGLPGDTHFPQFVRTDGEWRLAAGKERRRWHPDDEYESSFWEYERA